MFDIRGTYIRVIEQKYPSAFFEKVASDAKIYLLANYAVAVV